MQICGTSLSKQDFSDTDSVASHIYFSKAKQVEEAGGFVESDIVGNNAADHLAKSGMSDHIVNRNEHSGADDRIYLAAISQALILNISGNRFAEDMADFKTRVLTMTTQTSTPSRSSYLIGRRKRRHTRPTKSSNSDCGTTKMRPLLGFTTDSHRRRQTILSAPLAKAASRLRKRRPRDPFCPRLKKVPVEKLTARAARGRGVMRQLTQQWSTSNSCKTTKKILHPTSVWRSSYAETTQDSPVLGRPRTTT